MRRTLLRYALIAAPFVAICAAGTIGLLRTGSAVAQPAAITMIKIIRSATPVGPGNASTPAPLQLFATDCLGGGLPGNPMLVDGASVVIDVDGFAPNATVTLSVAGETTVPITQRADANGDVRTIYRVPSDLPAGQHVLVVGEAPATPAGLSAATSAGAAPPRAFYPFWVADAAATRNDPMYPGATHEASIQAADCGAIPPPPLRP